MDSVRIHTTADVSKDAEIGDGTSVWNNAQVREGTRIGSNCVISKNVYVDFDVEVGDNVKIQNNSSIYHGVVLERGVFIGPHVICTNDKQPRAINPDGSRKGSADWNVGRILVKEGASIGAGSVILPNVTLGRFCLVGAGSVVTKDVPDFTYGYGNPFVIKGYVCKCGVKIDPRSHCESCGVHRDGDSSPLE